MLPVVVIILVFIIVALLMRLFSLHRAMDAVTRELKDMNQTEPVHRHIQVPVPDRHLELLAEEINFYLTQSFSRSYEQKKREQDIRREITNISHDLRTPLTSILGYLELLLDEPLTEEQSEYIHIVQNRSKHLNLLISQLYEYARLEASGLPLKSELVDLTGVLKEHLLSYYQEYQDNGITLTPSLPDTALFIRGDRDALERILQNLTANVLRHACGQAAVTLAQEKGQALITYSNHCPGLTEEHVLHLFEAFYTADQARTAQRSGLGMTVARLLAQQMGGSMDAGLIDGRLEIQCRFPLAPQ
ncbi:MAG: HAMP domain-containing sensor histidine kinase [Eubacteriales bacterium]|nr:HAMP domain-containing sensor histidine kinase [Eubacteriales bacterium]